MRAPHGLSYYARHWLNEPGIYAGAYVVAAVGGRLPYGHLTISDCSRVITLEFNTDDEDYRRNFLAELDLLIDIADEMRAHLSAPPQADDTAENPHSENPAPECDSSPGSDSTPGGDS